MEQTAARSRWKATSDLTSLWRSPSLLFSSESLSGNNIEFKCATETKFQKQQQEQKNPFSWLNNSPGAGTLHLGQHSLSSSRYSGKQIELLICKSSVWEDFLVQAEQAHSALSSISRSVSWVFLSTQFCRVVQVFRVSPVSSREC